MHSGQIANFKTESTLDLKKMQKAFNANLKNSIVIKGIEEVEEDFHARYCAKEKTYRYIINNSEFRKCSI
jgi:tRNA pseudouridine38-40 synthase